jgi:zeaxanthin glucosyltransferase
MTHIGLICPAASGHLNPMTSLGHELRQRGHRVTLVGILDGQAKATAAGLEFAPFAETTFPLGFSANALATLGQLSGMAAFRYTVKLFQEGTIALLQEAPAAIQQAGIDLLLIDQTSFGASSIAEALGLPFISVCCALMINREVVVPPFNTSWPYSPSVWARLRNRLAYWLLTRAAQPIAQPVIAYRQQHRLPPITDPEAGYSQLAQLCQQPAEFEFPRQSLPPCFHFTGPYATPASREPAAFPFEQLTGQPLIYASLGTVQNRLVEAFEAIATACLGLDAQLVIALGGGCDPESFPALPGAPIVVGYAPQLELLPRAALTITHAGMNTTLESLSYGVPMVAIPIANDQPGVAARIAWTGTGEVVPLQQLSAAKLRTAIQRVLAQDRYKMRAMELQAAIQQAGGVKKAASIVEQVAATGKPVYSA